MVGSLTIFTGIGLSKWSGAGSAPVDWTERLDQTTSRDSIPIVSPCLPRTVASTNSLHPRQIRQMHRNREEESFVFRRNRTDSISNESIELRPFINSSSNRAWPMIEAGRMNCRPVKISGREINLPKHRAAPVRDKIPPTIGHLPGNLEPRDVPPPPAPSYLHPLFFHAMLENAADRTSDIELGSSGSSGLQFQRLYLLIPRNRKQVRRSDVLEHLLLSASAEGR